MTESIAFEEPNDAVGTETIFAKHTITDYSEEETTSIAEEMNLPRHPNRLALTIRQTMTKQCLSISEPLRILYVGNDSARHDILYKIASSVPASAERGKTGGNRRQSSSQLYNVVPVSAFGSLQTPEIELLQSSEFQIKVEACTLARSLKFEDAPEKPDVVKLTLEDNISYHSVPEGEGFIVEPAWELPHIAVIYSSSLDDLSARRTSTLVRKFMKRHNVPSIVIAHKQSFNRGDCIVLDQHSIHMCLESRDPDSRGSMIHRRLPIDLASFLNIDARQMNRNLAYLTGLHEPLQTTAHVESNPTAKVEASTESRISEKTSFNVKESISAAFDRIRVEWRAVIPVSLLVLSALAVALAGVASSGISSQPAISVNSRIISATPILTSSSTSSMSVVSGIPTSNTIVIPTSTKTVTVTQSAGPNSLSVVPTMELGKSFKPALSKPSNKSNVCTAEILGTREVLIRIPSATMLKWLNREALSVNVTRGNVSVDTERAYSTSEGVVLLLAQNQAYGVLNIHVITTTRPRVNESFQVDFGKSIWQAILEKYHSSFTEEPGPQSYEQIVAIMDKIVKDAQVNSKQAFDRIDELRKIAQEQAFSSTSHLARFAKALAQEATERSNTISKELNNQLNSAEAKLSKYSESLQELQEPLEKGLLKAQVQSKLLWLKLQRKHDDYREYEKRAIAAMGAKPAEGKNCWKTSRSRKESRTRKSCTARMAARREGRTDRKSGRKQRT
ncbi:hypothetical protein B0O99DRAFT_723764 [Bisporella sp. PMI_857]|nr:hypothetical protein B0O99DRAFT_723764 [Bisporella sp. PMI_857]